MNFHFLSLTNMSNIKENIHHSEGQLYKVHYV